MTAFDQIPIGNLLPQRPPFLFVDRLMHYDPVETRTEFRIREDTLFVEGGRMRTAGLVEHMAQSSAARIGYICRYILHVPVKIGYIGNVRKLKVYHHPSVGDLLETTVLFREDIFGITLTDIEIRSAGACIATASLKVALGDKEMEE